MTRSTDSPLLNSVFTDRWSPRSFTDDAVTDEEMAAVFEAARWSPSWMNNQPWLYVWAGAGDDEARDAILGTFMEFNREWASAAPVVGLALSRTELDGFMARTRDFDTGAAMMSLTLQAQMLGLSMHLLGGIELDAAYEVTGADRETTEIHCGFIIGRRGPADALSEKLQEREAPSDRKPVAEFAFRGSQLRTEG